jgi:hypothetical protein
MTLVVRYEVTCSQAISGCVVMLVEFILAHYASNV